MINPVPSCHPFSLRPITLRAANAFVALHHRHCQSTWRNGGRFAIQACQPHQSGAVTLLGVAIVARPVARALDDGLTAELIRLCVSPAAPRGIPSALYRASWRAWRAMGGTRLVTYTLATEPGTSLRAAGLTPVAQVTPGPWNRSARPRTDKPLYFMHKIRWQFAEEVSS